MQNILKAFCSIIILLLCAPAFAKPDSGIHTSHDTPTNEENEVLLNPQDATGTNPNSSAPDWYWFVLLPVVGAAAGYFIGKKIGSPDASVKTTITYDTTVAVPTNDTAAEPKEVKAKSKTSVELKQKYDKLREDHAALKQTNTTLKNRSKELEQMVDSDTAYFKTAFQEMVLPLQTAIDKGDVATVVKYLTLAAIQYSALTRLKLSRRQNYDTTNINTLMKLASDHEKYPEITPATPVDKTPANLRELVSALKQLGVKDLDNYILQGYKLKDR